MKSTSDIINFLDEHLKRHNKTHLSAVEAATLLEREGILKDSPQRPGKPLRDMLRKGFLPHAYQLADKGSEWVIPASDGLPFRRINPPADIRSISFPLNRSTGLTSEYFERIRAKYRPEIIKVLFVGESRPANDTFYYIGNSNLLSYTRNVFSRLLDRKFPSPESFLDYFCKTGYFLDDLCLEPVNKMEKVTRRRSREAGVSELANRFSDYSPKAVICIMKAIEPQVRKAVLQSGIRLEHGFHCVSFPSMSNQLKYQAELVSVLKKLGHF